MPESTKSSLSGNELTMLLCFLFMEAVGVVASVLKLRYPHFDIVFIIVRKYVQKKSLARATITVREAPCSAYV